MEQNVKTTREIIKVVIEDIREEAIGTLSFFFKIPEGMVWEAGSDIHFAHPDFMDSNTPDKSLIRHMSIMTLPEEGKIGFTTRVPGSGSAYKKRLGDLVVGDEMMMFKLGNRIPLRRENRSIVLISMGVGVATMRPIILEYLNDPSGIASVTNLVVDKEDQFVFRKELESINTDKIKNLFSSNRKMFYKNFESLQFDSNNIFYVIGNDGFLEDIIARLKAKGVRPENIEIDKKPEKKAIMLGN